MSNQVLMWLVAAVALMIAARILAGGFTMRGVLQTLFGWAAIGIIMFVAITHQREIGALLASLSDRLGVEQQKVEGETVRIPLSRDGHFWAKVRINGVERRMLVDSGATITALSEATAREAGIGSGGRPAVLETANGSVQARSVRVDRVAIGPMEARNLEVVVAPNFGDFDVLGMNFLSRLKSWRVEGKTLVLEPEASAERSSRPSNATRNQSERKTERRGDTADQSDRAHQREP